MSGVTIASETRGPDQAPPVLLVHSLGSSRAAWEPQVAALEGRFRLILVDLPGHGGSPAPPGPYEIADLGKDVIAAAGAAGAGTFHLCGLSIGGMVGLWAAVHRPDVLRSLIACNTAARIGTVDGWNGRIEAVRAEGLASISDAVVARWFAPDFPADHPEWHAAAVAGLVTTDPDGYIACCQALAAADLRPLVPSIDVPTLVIGGSLDVSTPPEEVQSLHRTIPDSEWHLIEGAAHLSNLDRPDEFTAVVARFIDQVEAAR